MHEAMDLTELDFRSRFHSLPATDLACSDPGLLSEEGASVHQAVAPDELLGPAQVIHPTAFMTTMSAIARANPEVIRNLFADHGNGLYYVTSYHRQGRQKRARTVQIDTRTAGFCATGPELWSRLMAMAWRGETSLEAQLEACLRGESETFYTAAEWPMTTLRQIERALHQRRPVLAAPSGFTPVGHMGICSSRAYSISSVSTLSERVYLSEREHDRNLVLSVEEFVASFERYVLGPAL